MIYKDDRTIEQHTTHQTVIWGRDKFLSGWGQATGGYSWAGWACKPEDTAACLQWVQSRGDMRYIRVGGSRPKGRAVKHVHVYTWEAHR